MLVTKLIQKAYGGLPIIFRPHSNLYLYYRDGYTVCQGLAYKRGEP